MKPAEKRPDTPTQQCRDDPRQAVRGAFDEESVTRTLDGLPGGRHCTAPQFTQLFELMVDISVSCRDGLLR